MSLAERITEFSKLNILVIGDTMIDAYYIGNITRMSPEAPVPIVAFNHKDHRPGGAANVALNLRSLGARALMCSVVGQDPEGHELKKLLDQDGIQTDGLFFDSQRPTTVKTRIIADEQHLLRMDHEVETPVSEPLEDLILKYVESVADNVNAIIFEDYNKGLLTGRIITETIKIASQKGVPTIVDPKKKHFLTYKGCTLFKPNRKEIKEGLPTDLDLSKPENVAQASEMLRSLLGCGMVMVTLSEDGVYICSEEKGKHIRAHQRTITDVSGAGDTVVSVAALCLAIGMQMEEMAELANISGGLVCQKVGVMPITRQELIQEVKLLGL